MGVLKKYVHNRARPEGSISKGYGTEEVIEFCVDFIPDLKSIGVPQSRHEGRLSGKGTLGKKAMICRDGHSFTQAHYTVLQSSTFVAPYIEEHKNIVRSENPGKADSWIIEKHMETFGSWLRTRLMNDEHCWRSALLVGRVTIFDYIDFPRVRDKWEYILHDRPR